MIDITNLQGKNVLVTTDDWFRGPCGTEYKCAYGKVQIVKAESALGFRPTQSTNWFMVVGSPGNQVVIFGCRIHFISISDQKPVSMNSICDLSEEKEISKESERRT